MSDHLLVVTPDFPPALGGIQRVVGEIAKRLASEHRVTVVAPAHPDARAADAVAPYEVVRTRSAWGGARSAAVLVEMAAQVCRSSATAVVAAHVMVLPAVLTRLRRRPTVALFYGSELWNPRAQHVLRRSSGRVEGFLAISEFTRRQAVTLGVPEEKIVVTPLGGDEPQPPSDAEERLALLGLVHAGETRPFLLTVSRLAEPHKGQDAVLRAVAAVATHEPEFRYVVAGGGPLRGHLEQVSRTSGASGATVFAGQVDEPTKAALLSRCRALAMVSRDARAAAQFEGFGLVYVEAALAGRPSLAGRAGAAPEVVVDGETGILVEPDRPAQVADAALRLLDGGFADSLGAEAQARARATATWAHAGDRLLAGIAGVVG